MPSSAWRAVTTRTDDRGGGVQTVTPGGTMGAGQPVHRATAGAELAEGLGGGDGGGGGGGGRGGVGAWRARWGAGGGAGGKVGARADFDTARARAIGGELDVVNVFA